MFSLGTTYIYSICLLDSIVTSFVLPYHPPCNALSIIPSIPTIDVIPPFSTCFSSGTRDSLV